MNQDFILEFIERIYEKNLKELNNFFETNIQKNEIEKNNWEIEKVYNEHVSTYENTKVDKLFSNVIKEKEKITSVEITKEGGDYNFWSKTKRFDKEKIISIYRIIKLEKLLK